MQRLIRISAISDRAGALHLGLPVLCAKVGIAPSSVYRWLSGSVDPRLSRYDKTCAAMEAELDRLEREHLDRLQARHPAPPAEAAP